MGAITAVYRFVCNGRLYMAVDHAQAFISFSKYNHRNVI